MTALLSLRDVTKTFYNGDFAVEVLHGISLDIAAGEFVAIIGQSGSGKSTLMNILGCLDQPTSGDYRIDGEPVAVPLGQPVGLNHEFVHASHALVTGSTRATARRRLRVTQI